jgi:hypothetical protein
MDSTQENTMTVEEMHNNADRRIGEVFRTMLIFTTLMVLGPIGTYFYSRTHIFESIKEVATWKK